MNKAAKRLQRVACIQKLRYQSIVSSYEGNLGCQNAFYSAIDSLDTYFGSDFCIENSDGTIDIGQAKDLFSDQAGNIGLYSDENLLFKEFKENNQVAISKSCDFLY